MIATPAWNFYGSFVVFDFPDRFIWLVDRAESDGESHFPLRKHLKTHWWIRQIPPQRFVDYLKRHQWGNPICRNSHHCHEGMRSIAEAIDQADYLTKDALACCPPFRNPWETEARMDSYLFVSRRKSGCRVLETLKNTPLSLRVVESERRGAKLQSWLNLPA